MFQSWQLKKKANLQLAPKMGISSSHVMKLTSQNLRKKRKRKRERKKKLNAEKRKAKIQLKK